MNPEDYRPGLCLDGSGHVVKARNEYSIWYSVWSRSQERRGDWAGRFSAKAMDTAAGPIALIPWLGEFFRGIQRCKFRHVR